MIESLSRANSSRRLVRRCFDALSQNMRQERAQRSWDRKIQQLKRRWTQRRVMRAWQAIAKENRAKVRDSRQSMALDHSDENRSQRLLVYRKRVLHGYDSNSNDLQIMSQRMSESQSNRVDDQSKRTPLTASNGDSRRKNENESEIEESEALQALEREIHTKVLRRYWRDWQSLSRSIRSHRGMTMRRAMTSWNRYRKLCLRFQWYVTRANRSHKHYLHNEYLRRWIIRWKRRRDRRNRFNPSNSSKMVQILLKRWIHRTKIIRKSHMNVYQGKKWSQYCHLRSLLTIWKSFTSRSIASRQSIRSIPLPSYQYILRRWSQYASKRRHLRYAMNRLKHHQTHSIGRRWFDVWLVRTMSQISHKRKLLAINQQRDEKLVALRLSKLKDLESQRQSLMNLRESLLASKEELRLRMNLTEKSYDQTNKELSEAQQAKESIQIQIKSVQSSVMTAREERERLKAVEVQLLHDYDIKQQQIRATTIGLEQERYELEKEVDLLQEEKKQWERKLQMALNRMKSEEIESQNAIQGAESVAVRAAEIVQLQKRAVEHLSSEDRNIAHQLLDVIRRIEELRQTSQEIVDEKQKEIRKLTSSVHVLASETGKTSH